MNKPFLKYRFPWRDGHTFRLLVDGADFFPAMLGAIAEARRFVLLEMYLFESGQLADQFIAALMEAAERRVRVYVLVDDFGALRLEKKDRQRLTSAGVHLAFYNPLRFNRWPSNLMRNHRKLLIVDGEVAFTGGAGITDEFDPESRPALHWHETMVEIRGPNVADWQTLFRDTWNRWGPFTLHLPVPSAPPATGESGRVVQGRPFGRSDVIRSLVNRLRKAGDRTWIATAYFVPSRKVIRLLCRTASKGVDVRLLLPGPHTDHPGVRHLGRRHYRRLLRCGVRIFEYQPRFLHAKVILSDDWLSIGSTNIDYWTNRWNLEANQEIRSPKLLQEAEDLFLRDFARCHEITMEEWRRRPRLNRWQEWIYEKLSALLSRLSHNHHGPDGPDRH